MQRSASCNFIPQRIEDTKHHYRSPTAPIFVSDPLLNSHLDSLGDLRAKV